MVMTGRTDDVGVDILVEVSTPKVEEGVLREFSTLEVGEDTLDEVTALGTMRK